MTRRILICLVTLSWVGVAGCSRNGIPATQRQSETTLTIGWGLTAGTRVEPLTQIITQEGLLSAGPDGRPIPWLAQSWTQSDDGLAWRFLLKPGVVFHDGSPVTAQAVKDGLAEEIPRNLGPSLDNVVSIEAPRASELIFHLKHRSALLPEALALNVPIHPSGANVGTGPFYRVGQTGDVSEFRANDRYHEGRPFIDRILIRQFSSVRAAWADMLRGRLDMLYEVGPDVLDLVKRGSGTKVYTYERPYAYVVMLNLLRPNLRSAEIRRALNAAINREELVATALDGHGRPADSPVWPQHWVSDASLPRFVYAPKILATQGHRISFTLLYSDPSFERLALVVQQQLRTIGVDVDLELTSIEEGVKRAQSGNFDAWLADLALGPGLFRESLFWKSGGPYNLGHYANANVDAAFEMAEAARDDTEYRHGAAAFQGAMINDPPGIFLAWSERDRAVSTRFAVHEESGRDILTTMRLWQLPQPAQMTRQN